ncbi:MAG: HAMP domain-containing histidine kinase [Deltaproteobacteria bacterium]|nr:HAMP domain-containing histidine kinase [Deltaproteobacteria bacterium]MBW2016071.1 HAMP domain-containing histidine kinase [Deltaproteobacteria bacterium]MBW2130468.1 HAMP domain-containing histidine kinase [Deltaproteobacteria bacterium]MBW2305098.1 HAMP domain-containing histidine kinase [Deltaproteobacteria bacterium]
MDIGKNRIKFDFLIHDLKVPLAVIEAGILSLLQKREKYGALSEKQERVLKRVLRNAIITRRLVNDALELGRSAKGIIHKTEFTLSSLLEQTLLEIFDLTDHEAAERIRASKDLGKLRDAMKDQGIILEIEESLWREKVSLDESKVKQVLRNLLNNALKYRKQLVELKISKGEGSLFISVSDDGEGIPLDYHQKIFECYFQMDMQKDHCVRGHGLGLAGVMVLVEDMGGELTLESDTGKGATFSVRIPI